MFKLFALLFIFFSHAILKSTNIHKTKGRVFMLYLNAKTIDEIANLDDFLQAVELAYDIEQKHEFHQPDRLHVNHDDTTLLYMPCFAGSVFGTKMLSIVPKNADKNLPVINGFVFLNDEETGNPLALIDGGTLTAYRTGAVGGVGIRHTVPENVETLGLVGTGLQGYYQILYACHVRNFKTIYLYNRTLEKATQFSKKLIKKFPDIDIKIAENINELTQKSEVIITATSSSDPVLPDDVNLLKNKHLIAIGSYTPDMRELPKAVFESVNTIYTDTLFAKQESGDLSIPLKEHWIKDSQIKSFSEALDHRGISNDTTLFKSVGMGLFDLIVADTLYKKAKEKGAGQHLD